MRSKEKTGSVARSRGTHRSDYRVGQRDQRDVEPPPIRTGSGSNARNARASRLSAYPPSSSSILGRMSMTAELEAFGRAARAAGLVLASTPARVCRATHAEFVTGVSLANTAGGPNEQFFKWQLVAALIRTGRIPADNIGCELSVPRGSAGSTDLHIDIAVFSDSSWVDIYDRIRRREPGVTWDDLMALLVGCGEVKADPADDMERTIRTQLIPALGAVTVPYALGIYFNAGHLVLCARATDVTGVSILRLDPTKQGTSGSIADRLNPSIPDAYELFPSLETVLTRGAAPAAVTRAHRAVADLDVMSSRSQRPVEVALDRINRVLDSTSLRAETGYRIVIETLAAKVYDEKTHPTALRFYIDPAELPATSTSISGPRAAFRDRMRALHADAQPHYPSILHTSAIQWTNPAHVKVIAEVVSGFQDMSFVRSTSSDLYQVVFYNFAGPLSKVAQAQFMTPLRLIDFMVDIANPKHAETVLDPTMGIADFLAVTYTRQQSAGESIRDSDLYGVDNDSSMLMLAALNMLLNGDGLAHLYHVADTGSLDHKLAIDAASGTTVVTPLDQALHQNGNWAFPPASGFILRGFDVVLTNPPFGDGRALKLDRAENRAIASLYETYRLVGGNQIDKGILFLENAFRALSTPGRLGIVLSTALSSVAEYRAARQWLLENSRLVAVFDMPKDIFAETGVPTSIIFACRYPDERLAELKRQDYEVYSQTVKRVGFTKVTRNRTTLLVDKYLVDPTTGRVRHDPTTGAPLVDEEFSEIVADFRDWVRTQEPELQALFL